MTDFIYVETTIPSFFHETRPAEIHQARRRWTREWWDVAPMDDLVTSLAVLEELERTPEPKRSRCLSLIHALRLLSSPPEIELLIETYFEHRLMPRDAEGDARHLALATFHRCAAIVTWNCKHLANQNKRAHIDHVNRLRGYSTPALVTPLALLEP